MVPRGLIAGAAVAALAAAPVRAAQRPAAPVATAPARLDVISVPPRLIALGGIRYPSCPAGGGERGTDIVEAELDTSGRPVAGTVRVVEARTPYLDSLAEAMVGGARFAPARVDGQAVPALVHVPVRFDSLPTAEQTAFDTAFVPAGCLDRVPALVTLEAVVPPAGARGEGGDVVLSFVLDTAGRVEPGTVRVLRSPGPEYAAAARRAVEGAVFTPAVWKGRAIRFEWSLTIGIKRR